MFDTSTLTSTAALASGLLVARLALGLAMASHGAQKLFGWFGGYGLAGTSGFFASIGFHPGRFFAFSAGATELLAGLLTALGLFGPVGPGLTIFVMVVAMASVHAAHGFYAVQNGIEVPFLYAAGAWALAFAGPGLYSADALLGLAAWWSPTTAWAVVGMALVAALINLSLRNAGSRAQTHAA